MMTNVERAKQFAPFDAMKGLQEALRDREERHSRVEKHEISEEDAERLSYTLRSLARGMKIRINCYHAYHDVILSGVIEDIDFNYRRLEISGKRIWFEDIYWIRIIDY